MYYLGLTTSRMIAPFPGAKKIRGEWAVKEQLDDIGCECLAPPKVVFQRKGKNRFPEPETSPYLRGYIFARIPSYLYSETRNIKGLHPRLMPIAPQEVRASIGPFMAKAQREYEEAMRIIERNDRAAMCEFEPGQAIELISGPFAGQIARFVRMVHKSGQLGIECEADLFGRKVKMEADPLDIRAAD